MSLLFIIFMYNQQKQQETFKHLNHQSISVPFELYPLQKRMMKMIMDAISKKKSIIIESPTGTGKTMCLLSATLEAVKQKGILRVYYLTRTHTQMDGIITQIKKTCYQPKFVIAQSKKALCVHQPALKKGEFMNVQQFNNLCFQAKSNNSKARENIQPCPMNIKFQNPQFPPYNQIQSQKDIKKYSESKGYCPERYQSALTNEAQLIIMPYIYMMNPFIFNQKNFKLQNSVILFDEAHNILQQAKEESSIDINFKSLAESKQQIQSLQKLSRLYLQSLSQSQLRLRMSVLQTLKNYWNSINQLLQKLKGYFSRVSSYQNQLFISLKQVINMFGFKMDKFIQFKNLNKLVIQALFGQLKSIKKDQTMYINKFYEICHKLDEIFNSQRYKDKYVCCIYYKKMQNNYSKYINIKFHCQSSRPLFQRLSKKKPIFIFASGTINPFQFKDTGLQMYNYFSPNYPEQNPYSNGNIQTFYVTYFKNTKLQVDFKSPNIKEIGAYIQEVIKFIPNGVLVFFKSYHYLKEFQQWATACYVDFGKKVFFEQRQGTKFNDVIRDYKNEAQKEKGAVLFGCMRGKASQGCNFENKTARAVFIIGIPYANIGSIECKIHKSLNDFDQWYNLEAMKAVNQAIGRVVRHKNDYGLVFLIGSKLKQKQEDLPKWLLLSRKYVNQTISKTIHQIRLFFDFKNKNSNKPIPRQDEYEQKFSGSEQFEQIFGQYI